MSQEVTQNLIKSTISALMGDRISENPKKRKDYQQMVAEAYAKSETPVIGSIYLIEVLFRLELDRITQNIQEKKK